MYKLLSFKEYRDDRGALIPFEAARQIPFGIQRIYTIYDTKPGVSRGFHAHKTLQQVLVCIKGSCIISLDTGESRDQISLNSPLIGLYIQGNIWREMHDFSEDCILMVFADQYFHEQDYIRDYDAFLEVIRSDT